MKKKVYGILLVATITSILLLTLQDAEGTVRLSEGVRNMLERVGIHMDSHSIRSNVHFVVYFVFGIVLCLFARTVGLKWWLVLIIGFGFGLLDESIKVLLPTREFDGIDLIKDWTGIGASVAVMSIRESWREDR